MADPNEQTDWAAQASPGEAKLYLKEPISEHDPNTGTEWAPPVDSSKPRVRVRREIDKFLDEPMWTCEDCGHQTLTETGRKAHLAPGADGMTPCQRAKANFKPLKDCIKCGGTGRGSGQCHSCNGGGEKCADCSGSGRAASCDGCSGSGKVQSDEAAPMAAAIDEDKLAAKIAEPIIESMNKGFAMLAKALVTGKLPKKTKAQKRAEREERAAKKKAKDADGGAGSVPGSPEDGGPEPVPAVERTDESVGHPASEPEEA